MERHSDMRRKVKKKENSTGEEGRGLSEEERGKLLMKEISGEKKVMETD